MGTRAAYQRTLIQAGLIAGDETSLAEKLGCSVPTVVDWLLGEREVSQSKQQVVETRAFLERVRSTHKRS